MPPEAAQPHQLCHTIPSWPLLLVTFPIHAAGPAEPEPEAKPAAADEILEPILSRPVVEFKESEAGREARMAW